MIIHEPNLSSGIQLEETMFKASPLTTIHYCERHCWDLCISNANFRFSTWTSRVKWWEFNKIDNINEIAELTNNIWVS